MSIIGLIAVSTYLSSIWLIIFGIVVSWVLSDFLISLAVRGGEGIAQIPILGTLTQNRGRAYLAFFVGIILVTAFSSFVVEFSPEFFYSLKLAEPMLVPFGGVILPENVVMSVLAGGLVYLDLRARFY